MFAGRLCTLVPKPRRDAILGASHADLFSASTMRQTAGVAFSMHGVLVLAGVQFDEEELVEATGQPAVGAMVSRGNSSLTTTSDKPELGFTRLLSLYPTLHMTCYASGLQGQQSVYLTALSPDLTLFTLHLPTEQSCLRSHSSSLASIATTLRPCLAETIVSSDFGARAWRSKISTQRLANTVVYRCRVLQATAVHGLVRRPRHGQLDAGRASFTNSRHGQYLESRSAHRRGRCLPRTPQPPRHAAQQPRVHLLACARVLHGHSVPDVQPGRHV